jgi:hypothetical protein
MESFTVEYKNYKEDYNLTLIKNKGNEHNLEKLKETYIELFKIFEAMENTDKPIVLYRLNQKIEKLEFKMQELWGFPQNADWHRYWFMCPKCTCPQMDNYDMIGSGQRYYGVNCPIHGVGMRQMLSRESKIKRILKIKDNE